MSDAWETLMGVAEGEEIEVTIEDFEDTRFPRDENPRTISGTVQNVSEEPGYGAGEIQRVVTVGDPWSDGCNIDCGDTSENNLNLTGGHGRRTYLKAWRPRSGKDRLLLGRVTEASMSEPGLETQCPHCGERQEPNCETGDLDICDQCGKKYQQFVNAV